MTIEPGPPQLGSAQPPPSQPGSPPEPRAESGPAGDEHEQLSGVAGATGDGRVFVVTANSMAVEAAPDQQAGSGRQGGQGDRGGQGDQGDQGGEGAGGDGTGAGARAADEGSPRSVTDMVEQPAKVMRIGNMVRQLLDEVKSAPLDDASRQRMRTIHQASMAEIKDSVAPELVEELDRITLPFSDDATPTDAELRIAQAQLVGWLEGLFHGIQTALFAQQMAARAQLEQNRRALPPGNLPGPSAGPDGPGTGGMYL